MNKVLDNPDLLYYILKFNSIKENTKIQSVNKTFNKVSKNVVKNQLNVRRFFARFKKRTIFPRRKTLRRTYYTLKNKYINRENRPILLI
tara:strand:+ start:1292 stop:1558 length:267 start_codon:yes stop_codon:yes gene_type:complete